MWGMRLDAEARRDGCPLDHAGKGRIPYRDGSYWSAVSVELIIRLISTVTFLH
jgi:hypothetical protein